MSTQLSVHAIEAMERLNDSWFINWMVRGSIHDPSMGGSSHHPNWRFFDAMERYLSVQQVCHAADILNSYCDLILADILQACPTEWENVKKFIKTPNLGDALARLRGHRLPGAREALREGVRSFWSPESDVICVLRNKLVHQGGFDPDRKVQETIDSQNGQWCAVHPTDLLEKVIPIGYSGDDLLVDAKTGYWSCRHVQNHIHLMDQNLCHRFALPTTRHRPRKLKFTSSQSHSALPFPPGTPLPTCQPALNFISPPETPSVDPDYTMITSEKEISCAQARMQIRKQFDDLVRSYCEEAGIAIVGISSGMPGSVLSHTIRGHDLNLSYNIRAQGCSDDTSERVEIRIREVDFEPLVTIFGTKSQMRDYTSNLLTDATDYLKSCIDKSPQ